MVTETLKIALRLSGTYWRRQPEYVVCVDGVEKSSALVETPSGESFNLEFDVNVEEDVDHILTVSLVNKMDVDTVQNEDKTVILKDMILNIESLEIDDISVGELLWKNSEYHMDDGDYMAECINLGKNGTWSFKFSSPFYIWLLENM